MLKEQMERGNNGLTKTKYITFGLYANSMKEAKPKLIHVETDLLNNFKRKSHDIRKFPYYFFEKSTNFIGIYDGLLFFDFLLFR